MDANYADIEYDIDLQENHFSGGSPSQGGPVRTSQRPLGITILAVVAFISGIIGILSWLSRFFGKPFWGSGGAAIVNGAYDYWLVLFILSALQMVFGYGAWQLKPWAWTLGVARQIISIAFSVWFVFMGSSLIAQLLAILIALCILFYLFTPDVKRAFNRQ
ncbi:MAG TPA: hypothetical protein VEX13_10025 [Chloroflexia bacterium]|nr:hypothetical protein [Chloroflexia bacterium]